MYTKEDLLKYDYFKDVNFDYALDSLTGVLTRANILGFAKHLIDQKIPFMMSLIDIDNFKLVNDNYGHMVGDGCLRFVGNGRADFVGSDGLVGRFGGDEFVIIYFKALEYDDVHDYIEKLFNEGHVVRRKISVDSYKFYITATAGCASFPKDALNYDDLFLTVDKALYRGKMKGRNCFIIYVESKHKNIEVHRKEQYSLPNIFSRVNELANNSNASFDEKIKNILNYVKSALRISEAALLFSDARIITSDDGYESEVNAECVKIFDCLTAANDIFIPTELNKVTENAKVANFISSKKIITFMASKIKFGKETIGYFILFEGKITRIWQESDIALLLYLNKVIEVLCK